jgi:glyoxylase-like metal-dependent hydrolase (beta-lactamase superfamily II)
MIHPIDLHFQGTKESIAVFLMETTIGPILFESGPYSTFDTLKVEIEKLGYKISDIKHVFITHIHFDHAGAAWKFAEYGANIYVHPAGLPHLNNPEKLWGSALRIYGESMNLLWGPMHPIAFNRLVPLQHLSVTLLGDTPIQAIHTPGHAIHHVAFSINGIVFCGDVGGVKIGKGPVVPPCPPPDIHIEDWCSSIRFIRALQPQKLYLTHFGIVESNIDNHFNELEATLMYYSQWVWEEMEKEKEIGNIIHSFQNMVESTWTELKMNEEDKLKYSLANPAFMSVNGLIRYWTKVKGKAWH